MPVYDYMCARCGPFTETRPMAESGLALDCPACGRKAPRAFLTAPYFATTSPDRSFARATAERGESAPGAPSGWQRFHGGGCNCCSGRSLRYGKASRGNGSSGRAR